METSSMLESLEKALENITPEEMEKYFPEDTRPKGWVSIEDHLSAWYAVDLRQGFSEFKVKFKDGKQGLTRVTDHNMWYYDAKDAGITYWWND